jgi:SAM-dependent methyltransferase
MAVNLARERAAAEQVGVEFVQGDTQASPYADESVDIVISCECMEHVPSPAKMALEIPRVLKALPAHDRELFQRYVLAWLMSWIRGEPLNSGSGVRPRENFFVFWMVSVYLRKGRPDYCSDGGLTLPVASPSARCPIEVVYAAI